MQARLRVGLERRFSAAAAAAAAAAGATARRRALDFLVAHVARADGADALGSSAAAEVEALRGEVTIELVERRQRGSALLGQLGRQQQARPVPYLVTSASPARSASRVPSALSAHEKRPASTAGRFDASLHARRASRSHSMAGNAVMAFASSIGRTCLFSADATSSGSCRCADPKFESAPEHAHAASVAATSIGRPSGLVRTPRAAAARRGG